MVLYEAYQLAFGQDEGRPGLFARLDRVGSDQDQVAPGSGSCPGRDGDGTS